MIMKGALRRMIKATRFLSVKNFLFNKKLKNKEPRVYYREIKINPYITRGSE